MAGMKKGVMSEAHKRAISEANKGKKYRKGKKHSKETKAKIRASVRNYYDSEEGQAEVEVRTEKTRQSIQARYDDDPEYAERVRAGIQAAYDAEDSTIAERISESNKAFFQTDDGMRRRQEIAENARQTHTGRKFTKEHRENMSKGLAKAMAEGRWEPGTYSLRGWHDSPLMGPVFYRSSYELEVFQQLDEDPDVEAYYPEPRDYIIPYEFDGITRNYIPDILVHYSDGDWVLVEIKPVDRLSEPQIIAKYKAAFKEFGKHFEVWTEEEIFV